MIGEEILHLDDKQKSSLAGDYRLATSICVGIGSVRVSSTLSTMLIQHTPNLTLRDTAQHKKFKFYVRVFNIYHLINLFSIFIILIVNNVINIF